MLSTLSLLLPWPRGNSGCKMQSPEGRLQSPLHTEQKPVPFVGIGEGAWKGLLGRGACVLAGALEEVTGAKDLAALGLMAMQQQATQDEPQGETTPSRGRGRASAWAPLHGLISPSQTGILQKLGRNNLAGAGISLTCRGS